MKATRICGVAGCERGGRIVRGMCRMHYNRQRSRGEIELLLTLSAAERLAAGLARMPNGCLEWTGSLDRKGYGRISVNDKYVGTHRVAWMLVNGPIPDGLCVLHHCDDPPCVQTDPTEGYPEGHLFLGTHADNNADKAAKKRSRNGNEAKTQCKRGHPFDEVNTYVPPTGRRHCLTCKKIRAASSN